MQTPDTETRRDVAEAPAPAAVAGRGARAPERAAARPAPPPKTPRELRTFGLVMAVPLGLIGAWMLWKGRPAGYYFCGGAALFLLAGLLAPRALAPVERGWMWLAERLSVVMTYAILTLTFFLVITPIGRIVRLTGRDLLQLRLDRSRTSYWDPVEPDGPASRADRPF